MKAKKIVNAFLKNDISPYDYVHGIVTRLSDMMVSSSDAIVSELLGLSFLCGNIRNTYHCMGGYPDEIVRRVDGESSFAADDFQKFVSIVGIEFMTAVNDALFRFSSFYREFENQRYITFDPTSDSIDINKLGNLVFDLSKKYGDAPIYAGNPIHAQYDSLIISLFENFMKSVAQYWGAVNMNIKDDDDGAYANLSKVVLENFQTIIHSSILAFFGDDIYFDGPNEILSAIETREIFSQVKCRISRYSDYLLANTGGPTKFYNILPIVLLPDIRVNYIKTINNLY